MRKQGFLVGVVVVAILFGGCAAKDGTSAVEVTDALCAELYANGGRPDLLTVRIACRRLGYPKKGE